MNISLSNTEADYEALSMAMREDLPLIPLLREIAEKGLDLHVSGTDIQCTVF